MTLGDLLKNQRRNKRKSLRQVQEETKIPNAHISQLENNKIKKPAIELLAKLAEYYNCELGDLMKMAGYEEGEGFDNAKEKAQIQWRAGIQNILKIVTAVDLINYSNRRESEGKLPEIIRKLITSTADVSQISMASGDSVSTGGWDGKVVFKSQYQHHFIPHGVSLWEMGKGGDYRSKANADFTKRTDNPLGEDIPLSTFVFVTMQRFAKRTEWLAEKKKESKWKEIAVIDADDLEHWLEIAPNVGLWLASEIGLMPEEKAIPLMTFWQEWWDSTEIPLTPDLLLNAMPNAVSDIKVFLEGQQQKRIKLCSSETSVAIAYLCSIIETIDSEEVKSSLWSRCVIVDDIHTFRKLAQQGHQLVLIPRFEEAPLGFAQNNGHKVFIASTQTKDGTGNLEIKRLPISAIEEHLQSEGGMSKHEAHRLARRTHGSPSILKRLLTDKIEVSSPEWTKQDIGSQLIPILLAGSWDSANEGDQEILSLLCRKSYSDIEQVVQSLCPVEIPPCKKIGSLYTLTSQEYVYSYLREYISPQILQLLKDAALRVLAEIDPKYELEKEDRFAALIHGKRRRYSGALRKGISTTLVLLSTQPPDIYPETEAFVENIVYELFKGKHSWQFWASISDVLQILTEAAPEGFLNAMESIEANPDSNIAEIFRQTTSMGGCDYSNILWALECCAWNTEYLGRIINILVYFSNMEDRGSNYLNQPSNSALSLLSLWYPQSTAPLAKRFEILDSIIQRNSNSGWWLLMGLIPSRHGFGSNNAKPQYRDWADSHTGKVSNKELYDGIKMICDRIPNLIDKDKNRWGIVLEKLMDIPFMDVRHQLLDKLLHENLDEIEKELRLKIWKGLEEEVYRYKEFPDAAWAIGGELLGKLEAVYNHFAPSDIYEKCSRIFGYGFRHPACISLNHDYKVQEQLMQELQKNALREVFEKDGIGGIEKLCFISEHPNVLGATISTISEVTEDELPFVSNHLTKDDSKICVMLGGYIWRRYYEGGHEWLRNLFERCAHFPPKHKLKMLLWLPFKRDVWNQAKLLGPEIENKYWSQLSAEVIPWEKEETLFVIETFIKHERPLAAYCLLCHSSYVYTLDPIPSPLIIASLNGLLTCAPDTKDWESAKHKLGHDLKHLLETLVKRTDIDKKELAKIEWAIMPMAGYDDNKPSNLVNWIDSDPNVFCEIIEMTFRSEEDNNKDEQLTEQKKMLVRRGYDLLHNYRHVPGLTKDGMLDSNHLIDWISKVRERSATLKRLKIADDTIGHILAHTPVDPNDHIWPHTTVRDILETYKSQEIEDGLRIGVYNKRGFVTKGCFEGGGQERALAQQYRNWATACEGRWVRVSKVLRELEKGYRREAEREDTRAEADRHFSE